MTSPSGEGGGGILLRRGTLREALRERTARALRIGALQPIPTEFDFIEEGGVRFLVRILTGLARKDEERWRREKEAREQGRDVNPFLPYEEDLFVAGLTETHLCLLNKFNVVDEHLLIVTRRFEDQEEYLGEEDFEAMLAGLGEYESLAFYNGGVVAGASQRHKHLQLVPLPLAPGAAPVPVEDVLGDAGRGGSVGRSPRLPFLHAVAPVDPGWVQDPSAAAPAARRRFGEMLQAVGMENEPPRPGARQSMPYNLLATGRWMLLVPRSKECFDGVSVNALGFAGALLVRDAAQMARLRETGPLSALREVAFARAVDERT